MNKSSLLALFGRNMAFFILIATFTPITYACQGSQTTCPGGPGIAPSSCSINADKCKGYTTCPVTNCYCGSNPNNGQENEGQCYCTKTC